MNLHKYTEKQLREAVADSPSLRQTLSKLGVVPAGGNYETLKKAIKHFDIDTSHHTGQLWSKGRTLGPVRPVEYYLTKNEKYSNAIQSNSLKKRLIKENYFEHKCAKCELSEWLDQPIALELEHKDGDKYNNLIGNLELLCPNCHAQTSTYRGKNIGAYD